MGTKMAEPIFTLADYANGWPTGQALKDAGFNGAIRYITAPAWMNPVGRNQKHMTRAEYEDHQAAGAITYFVFQGNTTDADSGYAGGVANAQLALAGLNYLGAPTYSPVFFTNDRPTLPNPSAWQKYLQGARSVLGRVGQYGFRNAIDAGWLFADWHWQCGSQSALRDGVHIYQWNNGNKVVSGVTCDINYVYHDLNGVTDMQWNDVVTVTTADGKYSEKHTVGELFSSTWFKGNDTYNALWGVIDAPPTLKKITDRLDALEISDVTGGGSTPADVATKADLLQLRQDLQPLFDLAARLKD